MQSVLLGDTRIYCSSWKDMQQEGSRGLFTPDFGLYADYVWKNESRNEYINWPDFKSPLFPDVAVQQILDALDRAETSMVEIGCIGAHGRTGTILACMASAKLGIDSLEAIDFVRSNYCHHAIETSSQEMFIEYFWRTINV
jgi:protein-tyrosine phosphatase